MCRRPAVPHNAHPIGHREGVTVREGLDIPEYALRHHRRLGRPPSHHEPIGSCERGWLAERNGRDEWLRLPLEVGHPPDVALGTDAPHRAAGDLLRLPLFVSWVAQ